MLDGMDALQTAPVLEPNHPLASTRGDEVVIDEGVDFGARGGGEVVGGRVGAEFEFGPDDEVGDLGGEAVGPVVV